MKCLGAVTQKTQGAMKNQSTPPLTKQNNGYPLTSQMITKKSKKTTALWLEPFGILLAVMLLGSPNGYTATTEPDFEKMATAIYFTEGTYKTRHPFGVLSVKCQGYTECRSVTLRSLKRRWQEYQLKNMNTPFEEYFASKWAPLNAENDPTGLNKNWISNFKFFLEKL